MPRILVFYTLDTEDKEVEIYIPGNQHIPPIEKEYHLPKVLLKRGYVSSREDALLLIHHLALW